MNVLLIVLAVLIVLVVLYLVAWKFEPVGKSIGFLCALLANVFVSIKEYMEKSAVFCKNACTASLRFPPGITDGDYWQGVIVLSRNVFFVVALCCLGGETFGTLEVVPSLFQSANHFGRRHDHRNRFRCQPGQRQCLAGQHLRRGCQLE